MAGQNDDFGKLMKIWVRIMDMMNEAESVKRDYGTGVVLSPAEIHTLQAIGDHPGINVTDLASLMGVTKGAISQMTGRLAAKQLVSRYSDVKNSKEVLLRLTDCGEIAHKTHNDHHARFIAEVRASLGDLTAEQMQALEKFLDAVETCLDDFNRTVA